MATEITDGGQQLLDINQKRREGSLPIDQVFSPDFVDHDPAEGQPGGGEGLMWYWDGFAESFSDVKRDIIETIATAEHVTTVMDLSGRHTGDFMGHSATGRTFSVRNVQVMKFAGGRVTERWGSTDQLGILQQLGLI